MEHQPLAFAQVEDPSSKSISHFLLDIISPCYDSTCYSISCATSLTQPMLAFPDPEAHRQSQLHVLNQQKLITATSTHK